MRRRRSGMTIALRILLILIILGAIAFGGYYFLTAYHIDPDKIYVEGNSHYSDQEIIDLVMVGPLGDNSRYLAFRYRNRKVKDIPFVDAITVSVLTEDSVQITVFEKALAGYVYYLDRYVYFDKEGTVVESSNVLTVGIPQVTGLNYTGIELGKPLTTDESQLFARTLDLTKMMDKYQLTISRIHFHDSGEVTLYFGDVRVDLGNESAHLEDKIMLIPIFLEKVQDMKGVLNMKEYSEEGVYVFSPDS